MRLKLILTATIFAFIVPVFTVAAAAEGNCQYNDRAYSSGATVCECPKFSGRMIGANLRNGRIISRRLVCEQTAWQPTSELCVDLNFGNSNDLYGAMDRMSQDLCPAAIGSASES
jgi:hypothetical protein